MDFDFERIFHLTTAPQAVLDHGHRVLLANDACCDLTGVPMQTLIGSNIFDLFPQSKGWQKAVQTALDQAFNGHATSPRESYRQDQDGRDTDDEFNQRLGFVDCIPLPPSDELGALLLIRFKEGTADAASQRKRDLIAAELQHRIGNLMTLVQVLARKTAQSAETLETFLPAFEERIGSLGKTHAFLSGPNWKSMTLRQVLRQQLKEAMRLREGSIVLEGPDWHLSVIHAQAFAMAIHELATNSIKFGALGSEVGQVQVAWDHPSDGSYNFLWKERGVDRLVAPEKRGFGMQMLTLLLPAQLGGKAVHSFTPTGFHYALVVPKQPVVSVAQSADGRP